MTEIGNLNSVSQLWDQQLDSAQVIMINDFDTSLGRVSFRVFQKLSDGYLANIDMGASELNEDFRKLADALLQAVDITGAGTHKIFIHIDMSGKMSLRVLNISQDSENPAA